MSGPNVEQAKEQVQDITSETGEQVKENKDNPTVSFENTEKNLSIAKTITEFINGENPVDKKSDVFNDKNTKITSSIIKNILEARNTQSSTIGENINKLNNIYSIISNIGGGKNTEIQKNLLSKTGKGEKSFLTVSRDTINSYVFDFVALKKMTQEDKNKYTTLHTNIENADSEGWKSIFKDPNSNNLITTLFEQNITMIENNYPNASDSLLKTLGLIYSKKQFESGNSSHIEKNGRVLEKNPWNISLLNSINKDNITLLNEGDKRSLSKQIEWSLDNALGKGLGTGDYLSIQTPEEMTTYKNKAKELFTQNYIGIHEKISHLEFNLLTKDILTNIGKGNVPWYSTDTQQNRLQNIGEDYLYQTVYADISPKQATIYNDFNPEDIKEIQNKFEKAKQQYIKGEIQSIDESYVRENILRPNDQKINKSIV